MASRLTTFIVVLIVAGTLIAGLMVGAQRDDLSGPIDIIVTNGKIYTGTADKFAEALAIRGNKILVVGSNRTIKRLRRAQTVALDAHGATVLPGFNDAHVRLLDGGLRLTDVDLSGADTLDAIESTVGAFAASHSDYTWIRGRGWSELAFANEPPTKTFLDAIVSDRPVYLMSDDGRTGWANTRALQLAGITRRTKNPQRGTIVKEPRTGEPTGVLKDGAQALVQAVMPQPTPEQRAAALRAAIREAQRVGITSVQHAGASPDELVLYDELRKSGELQIRLYASLSMAPGSSDASGLDAIRAKYPDDPVLKAGAVALATDGPIDTHAAAMLQPWADHQTVTAPTYTPDELNRSVSQLDARGWQVLINAVGDSAVRLSLDAFEQAAHVNKAPARGRRHRIEQPAAIDPADLPRFKTLGVIASEQPATTGRQLPDMWSDMLGPERAAQLWPFRSLLNAGGRLAFGSNWPDAPLDPRIGLDAAVTRAMPDGAPDDGWSPAERLTLATAIDAYTSGAAYASFDEHRKGVLARNMLADVVILSADIFAPDAHVLDAVVDTTIFDGRIVHTRTPARATD
jgi:predicted amidohydrolase YtcJ